MRVWLYNERVELVSITSRSELPLHVKLAVNKYSSLFIVDRFDLFKPLKPQPLVEAEGLRNTCTSDIGYLCASEAVLSPVLDPTH